MRVNLGDQQLPICSRCQDNTRECIKPFTFRQFKASFSRTQKWFNIRRPLEYVDETIRISSFYASEISTPLPYVSEQSIDEDTITSPYSEHSNSSDKVVASPNNQIDVARQTRFSLEERFCPSNFSDRPEVSTGRAGLSDLSSSLPIQHVDSGDYRLPSITSLLTPERAPIKIVTRLDSSCQSFQTYQLPKISVDPCIWPLTDPREAFLLRHYIQHLATWLDLCDPIQHFQNIVPQRASSSRILLNAIFALSARHLHKTQDYDCYESNRYHDECLKYLIPLLNDASSISDENIFAATIILRVLEEIEVADNGTDPSQHMFGIQVFVSAIDPAPMRGDLIEAAFWVGLRQEIYSSLTHHKPLKLNLEHCQIDRTTLATTDYAWSNRAIVHCADVLNFCFNSLNTKNYEWSFLSRYNKSWKQARPETFEPFFYKPAGRGAVIPEIWHKQANHIIGVQHHLLASLLLHIFDPSIPKTGPHRRKAEASRQPTIRHDLMELCGIGLYNDWTPPAMFTASMGIALCGDRITNLEDQKALMDILVRTEKDHARPTKSVRDILRESWGWKD